MLSKCERLKYIKVEVLLCYRRDYMRIIYTNHRRKMTITSSFYHFLWYDKHDCVVKSTQWCHNLYVNFITICFNHSFVNDMSLK